MDLPVMPPVSPMLAKINDQMPRGEGWLYEPKWDGFRAIVFRDGDEIHVGSRDGKALERYFPELVPTLAAALPPRCVIDGEVVVPGAEGLDFGALLQRIHPARSRIEKLAAETPGSFVAFDVLALGDDDLTTRPLEERRARLAAELDGRAMPLDRTTARKARRAKATALFGRDRGSRVHLTPQTDEPDLAMVWFDRFEDIGLDGLIVKRRDLLYRPGDRAMVKFKHHRSADCVVGGYRLSKTGDGVGSLLLGLYDSGGVLHYVGHTSSFKAKERRALLEQLRELEGGTSFGTGRTPGGPSRWAAATASEWTPLEPRLVCEVRFDYLQGDRFRHAATFVRWRDDRDPRSCTFDQLASSSG
ncbi:MAG: ATP-dependent DNA ligase [Actinomycetota bacterium]